MEMEMEITIRDLLKKNDKQGWLSWTDHIKLAKLEGRA